MIDILIYLSFTLVGVAIGTWARKANKNMSFTGIVQMIAITFLVLGMGIRMGSNQEVIDNLGSIGVYAFIFTVITLILVIICMCITRKAIGMNHYGYMKSTEPKEITESKGKEENNGKTRVVNTTTLIILGSVIVGMLVGYFFIKDAVASNYEEFSENINFAITSGLCILLVFVGIDIGMAGTIIENFKKVGARVLLFPLVCIVGTMGAGLISCLFMPISIKEGLAIAGGFGWYTLAPGIIMEAGLVTASAISFMHNVMRELFAILLIPLVAKKIGYVETIGLPGAAAMDVCLPIVEKSTNSTVAVYSFLSGAILSLLVPVLVPFIVSF